MQATSRKSAIIDWLWLIAWGVASSAWCVGAARELGATYDEPVYFERGLDFWRSHSHYGLLKLGTMPLPIDVTTFPVYVWERWHGVHVDPQADLDGFLPLFRAGTLAFWWLLLFYGLRAGRQIAGAWGGRVAVALMACEPSLIAHASLATTDIAISACLLAFVYHYRASREADHDAGWLRRVGIPGFWFGACVLSKASGLMFGPLCMFAVELERRARTGSLVTPTQDVGWRARLRATWNDWRRWRRLCWQIVGLGLVIVFVYCGCDWQPQASALTWARHLPRSPVNSTILWVVEHARLFSNAGEGLSRQILHNCRGHGVYLLGETRPRALWYYFPVALTIKLSVPLLILPVLLLLIRPRVLLNWACAAAGVLLLFSLTYRVQIGIRLVLPLVVLAAAGLAAGLVNAARSFDSLSVRRLLVGGSIACIVWTAGASIRVWPEGLCYTNRLWGGTSRGYRLLSDSNYDWGQGLPELRRWQAAHHVTDLDVWYMGSDPAIKSLPVRYVPLQNLPLQRPEDLSSQERGRLLAASTTFVYGAFANTDAHKLVAAYLQSIRPIARTQTYLIYDFGSMAAKASRPATKKDEHAE